MFHITAMDKQIHANNPLDANKTLCGYGELSWYSSPKGGARGLAGFNKINSVVTKKKITCVKCLTIINHCRS